MKIKYRTRRFHRTTRDLIAHCEQIVLAYQAQGYDLTVRQLHYQLVSKNVYANTQLNYCKLGDAIGNARMAGMIDWYAIVDRTRYLRGNAHSTDPEEELRRAADAFYLSHWANMDHYVEVWIEKDALIGILYKTCTDLDVPYFSCRGYASQSAMWRAAMRINARADEGKECVLIHLSDHDPSGIDMSRDIEHRLSEFGCTPIITRLALTMPQVRQHNPPPNFAKKLDPRFRDYSAQWGSDSWELDALSPQIISGLVETEVRKYVEQNVWDQAEAEQADARKEMRLISNNYDRTILLLDDKCDECGGKGHLHEEGEDFHTCPVCDGSGDRVDNDDIIEIRQDWALASNAYDQLEEVYRNRIDIATELFNTTLDQAAKDLNTANQLYDTAFEDAQDYRTKMERATAQRDMNLALIELAVEAVGQKKTPLAKELRRILAP